jgi:hypothetical protein
LIKGTVPGRLPEKGVKPFVWGSKNDATDAQATFGRSNPAAALW